jgi:two-component system, OmpR family, sensor histidine kinase QseC
MKLSNLVTRHMERSLFKRYLLTAMLSIISLFAFLTALLMHFAIDIDDVDRELRLPARAIGEFTTLVKPEQLKMVGEKVDALNREFSYQKISTQDFHYAIFNRSYALLASSAAAPATVMRDSAQALSEKATLTNRWYTKAVLQKESSVIVVVAASEAYINNALMQAVPQILQSMLITLLVSIVVVWLSSRFALRPLSTLVKQVNLLNAPSFEQLRPEREFTELKPLVHAINARTQEMQANLQRERAFFSDAAHELRTPLAVINAQAYRVVKSNEELERRGALHALEAGVQRAAHLLTSLLNLARLDSTAVELHAQGIDLAEVAAKVVAQHASRAFAQQQEISLSNDAHHALVKGNESDVQSIIENLVDNAIRYAGQGAFIMVETGDVDAHHAYVAVSDSGPGMTSTDEAQAFERFKRGSQSVHSAGSGLGLAIVKATAARLNGQVSLSKGADAGGLRVKVMLPKLT